MQSPADFLARWQYAGLFAVILVFSVLQFRLLRGHTEY